MVFLSTVCLVTTVLAKDLGVHGRIYPIVENDLVTLLQKRAQHDLDSGRWDERVEDWKVQAKQSANRPKGIRLPRAQKTRSRLHDPSIVVPRDILDARGNLLYRAGSRANPLDYIRMNRYLVFIDGDDTEQIDWMRQLTVDRSEAYKVILTNGPVIDLMVDLNQRLYFDQHQVLVTRLGIQSLPALVYQADHYLRIDEVKLP